MTSIVRRLKYTVVADVIDLVIRTTPLLDGGFAPPGVINYAGGGDFESVGSGLARALVDRAGLVDGEQVLDVGCGIGRTAAALAVSHPALRYRGFDVVRYGISWCRKRFRDQPTYRFQHADIHNDFYHPRGGTAATDYRFPYPDATFDLVFATSVYTHMQYPEVAHYLHETARCLRPGGRAYVTCFILDDASRAAIGAGQAAFRFQHPVDHGRTESEREPDQAVAFDAPSFEGAVTAAGMSVGAFHAGGWRGRPGDEFQDAYLLRRAVEVHAA